MSSPLNKYLKKRAKYLQANSITLTDTSGVEIGRHGDIVPNIQLLTAIFQTTAENSAKISIGEAHCVTLFYNNQMLIQKSFGSIVLTLSLPSDCSVGRVLAAFPQIQEDLAPLISIITVN